MLATPNMGTTCWTLGSTAAGLSMPTSAMTVERCCRGPRKLGPARPPQNPRGPRRKRRGGHGDHEKDGIRREARALRQHPPRVHGREQREHQAAGDDVDSHVPPTLMVVDALP